MSAQVIESYLVSLGFETDQPSLNKFQSALTQTGAAVGSMVGRGVGDILRFQIAVTTAFVAAGFGVIGFVDKLAASDQQMRLFAMRSFQTIDQARGIQVALDTLGVKLEDVAWDKELHERFTTLIQDQKDLAGILGPTYEKQMHDVRDLWFQVQRLEVKGEYFGMKFASDLLRKLGIGDGDILASLMKLNDFVLQNMPKWADEISTDLVPILKDFWMILTDVGHVAGDVALDFTNLIGLVSGNTAIVGATFDFHKFATAAETLAHWLAVVVHWLFEIERGLLAVSPVGAIASILKMLPDAAGAGAAATPEPAGGGQRRSVGGSIADQARQVAKNVSAATGIPADLIFGQWAHETGGFTNRGATGGLNNLGGIRYAGSTEYRKFDSVDDFGKFYEHLIESKRYTSRGVNQARTPEEFAHALKAGGYFEDSEANYARGVRSFRGTFDGGRGGGATITVGSIPITITRPGVGEHEISRAVQQGVKAGLDAHNQNSMTKLDGAYA